MYTLRLRIFGLVALTLLLALAAGVANYPSIRGILKTAHILSTADAQVADSPVAPFLHPVASVREVTNPDNSDARLFLHNLADSKLLVSFDLYKGLDGNSTLISSGTLDHFTGHIDDPNLAGDAGSYFVVFHVDHCDMCATLTQPVNLKAGIDTVIEFEVVTFD